MGTDTSPAGAPVRPRRPVPDPEVAALGLREVKKRETRQLISDHATRLFVEQGFEDTTITDIATAARVAKKTVTNYFPRKEELALDHQEEFVAGPARTVRERASGESALAALRRAFLAAVADEDPVAGFAGHEFSRMVADSPTLSACLRGLHDRREQALLAVLSEAVGEPAESVTVRTAASLLGGVHRVLFQRIQELTLAGQDNREIARTLAREAARAFDLLAPSLGDYAVRP
ncbi:TetR/AcrR family transcriptional regulator [Streptomyces cacaoi]|uniref:TetR family transcriptional regulator n=1 Tax=Streptomyces cacaoi TaxID=1898 RepID=A0A4Y3R1N5_STRCI|nr:TetR/AcrR family transcriptional regulator [Streptomyces cacaoi]NNG86905.1 TetR/AcrR family transcriptional regulator [Streptomyces cacaoi]GEB51491.1 TetR family transcriptional regulator [Streptomyces cacaoi]